MRIKRRHLKNFFNVCFFIHFLVWLFISFFCKFSVFKFHSFSFFYIFISIFKNILFLVLSFPSFFNLCQSPLLSQSFFLSSLSCFSDLHFFLIFFYLIFSFLFFFPLCKSLPFITFFFLLYLGFQIWHFSFIF